MLCESQQEHGSCCGEKVEPIVELRVRMATTYGVGTNTKGLSQSFYGSEILVT